MQHVTLFNEDLEKIKLNESAGKNKTKFLTVGGAYRAIFSTLGRTFWFPQKGPKVPDARNPTAGSGFGGGYGEII